LPCPGRSALLVYWPGVCCIVLAECGITFRCWGRSEYAAARPSTPPPLVSTEFDDVHPILYFEEAKRKKERKKEKKRDKLLLPTHFRANQPSTHNQNSNVKIGKFPSIATQRAARPALCWPLS
jgi:hypothetical protein